MKCVFVLNKLNLNNISDIGNDERVPLWRNSIPLPFMIDVIRLPGSEVRMEVILVKLLLVLSC